MPRFRFRIGHDADVDPGRAMECTSVEDARAMAAQFVGQLVSEMGGLSSMRTSPCRFRTTMA